MIIRILLLHCFILIVSSVEAQKTHKVLVTYYSNSGSTEQMAKAVAKGVGENESVIVVLKHINETTEDDLINADAIILGSPVYNANPAPEVLKFIERWPFRNGVLKNKIGGVFVTGGGISSGEELVQTSILHAMMIFGMIIVGGDEWTSPFGASAITDEAEFSRLLNQHFLDKGERLGKRIREVVLRWN